jgi:hypothetical protein
MDKILNMKIHRPFLVIAIILLSIMLLGVFSIVMSIMHPLENPGVPAPKGFEATNTQIAIWNQQTVTAVAKQTQLIDR